MKSATRYARNGDVHLAYLTAGEGSLNLLYVPTWIQQAEHLWAHPRIRPFFERLASFSRLVMFDRRGTGLSDHVSEPIPLEEQMEDIVAVLDAARVDQVAIMAQLEGCAMAALFAATHPERTRALVLYAPMPKMSPSPGYDWPLAAEARAAWVEDMMRTWGDGSRILSLSPSENVDPSMRKWYGELERLSIPPGSIPIFQQMMANTDVLDVLPAIQAPTLVIQRAHDRFADPRHGRYVAAHVPGARLVELPGDETLMPISGGDAYLDEVEEFLTGTRRAPVTDRVLATVLFTDIVGSTERAAALGDSAWRELLARHDVIVRDHVAQHRGRFVKSLGDGILATFDGPARAIRGALAIGRTVAELGLEVRAGVHTGEIEVLGDDVGGLAVHIGARVSALAEPGEVLVSGTVKDLVVGSGLAFTERGEHALKGVPGEWRLFRVDG